MTMVKIVRAWIYHLRVWYCLKRQWTRSVALVDRVSIVGDNALIIPCDPWGVVGSRGDQAMILSVLQHCRERQIDILTDSPATDAACRELRMNPLPQWNVPFDKWMRENAARYSQVFILGADVTDGVYGWTVSMKLLMFYDCFSRLGVETHYLGFSWSKTPSPWMHLVLPFLKKGLPLPVRDPVSLERLTRFTRHRPLVQVADAAFLLKPNETPRTRLWTDWCGAQKASGKTVIAINAHQMFNDAAAKSDAWEAAFASMLNRMREARPEIAYLLVPHDNRPTVSDLPVLRRLSAQIQGATLVDCVLNADEIKQILGGCDALVAGRMHLSIAALGQCVPVMGLVYQGKFEGLWEHFGLLSDTLMNPSEPLLDPEKAFLKMSGFVATLPQVRQQIAARLPSVLKLAEGNFS